MPTCRRCADTWRRRLLADHADVPRFASREELYHHVNATYFDNGAAAIDLFEFGVFGGHSLRQWCALNRNPASRLYGFDSFRGLPEDWKPGRSAGAFSTNGEPPSIHDPRVQLVVGLFQQALPVFLHTYRPAGPLVVHNDCDLYSSTLYCLTRLHDVLAPGSIIVFDEFDDVLHESRALRDYSSAYMRPYSMVAATTHLTQAVVRLL